MAQFHFSGYKNKKKQYIKDLNHLVNYECLSGKEKNTSNEALCHAFF